MSSRNSVQNFSESSSERSPLQASGDRPVPSLEPLQVLGLPVHYSDQYLRWLAAQLQQQQGVHVVTLNAEMAMQARENAALAEVIHQANLVVPDGAGVVLYFRLRGRVIPRCPGIELSEALLQYLGTTAQTEIPELSRRSAFFFGGAPGVTQQAAELWQSRLPRLAIAGTQHGYLSDDERSELLHHLEATQPGVIFVGLGVPRQEFWIAQNRDRCPHSIWIGVGGSFDIWAGTKTRAPRWLRDNHLEWVYRLYQEPWRWRRMLALPRFAWCALRHS